MHRWWSSGLFGLTMGLLAVGTPTGSGALINLDLIAIGDLDVPPSLVALGSEFPRRAPIYVLWAVLSPPMSAAAVTKLWMVVIIAGATSGTVRYMRDVPWPIAWGAGVAYALSPYLLTRIGVGHLGLASAAALLPWAFATLTRPLEHTRRSYLWLCAFAMCGYFGFLVALPLLIVGSALGRRGPSLRQLGGVVVSQTPWLVPAMLSLPEASGAAGADRFDTDLATVGDWLRLPLGFGFWRSSNQIGRADAWTVLVVLLLALLAWFGWRFSRGRDGSRLLSLGLVGVAIAAWSVVPGLDALYDALTETVVFAPLREGHRMAGFTVFALVALAGRGLSVLADERRWIEVGSGAALGLSMVIVTGATYGTLDGATTVHEVPDEWHEAAALVAADRGITVALPWNQYFDVAIADGRRGHHPLPFLLEGDVIISHDLELGARRQISLDDREAATTVMVRALRFGEPIGTMLELLGVDWVVALPDLGTDDITRLEAVPELELVVDSPSIAVFRGPGGAGDLLTDWDNRATLVVVADAAWLALLIWIAAQVTRPGEAVANVSDATSTDEMS